MFGFFPGFLSHDDGTDDDATLKFQIVDGTGYLIFFLGCDVIFLLLLAAEVVCFSSYCEV